MRTRKRRHEERVVRIIAAIEGEKVPMSEVSVPRAELPIDVVMSLGLPSRAWGPIRLCLAHRRVCVEHFSGSPDIASLSRSLAKHAFVVEEWWSSLESALARDRVKDLASRVPLTISLVLPSAVHDGNLVNETRSSTVHGSEGWPGEPRAGEAVVGKAQAGEIEAVEPRDSAGLLELFPPALLVLSAGYPRQALSGRLDLPPSDCPGIWHSHRPLLGDIILVHLRGLPPDAPGCALLRFMATPTSQAEARRLIAGLMSDQTMLDSERNRLMEHAMDGIIPTTTSEKVSILDRIRAETRAETLKELESKKGSTLERIRAVMREEVRAEVQKEFRAQLQKEARAELRKEVRAELQKEVRAELRKEVLEELDSSLATLARSVLKVLDARGIKVRPSERKRIRACRDLAVLEAWHDKSFQVASASELLE